MQVSIEMKMGRLLEIRVRSGYRSAAEVDAMFARLAAVVAANAPAPQQHVTVVDWRQCLLMSGDAAARLQEGMAQTNPLVLRAALLASHDSPSAVMQFMRIVRASEHDGRRVFFDEVALTKWLGEVLTPMESARLRVFLRQR